jgi:penicillin-binding protein 2
MHTTKASPLQLKISQLFWIFLFIVCVITGRLAYLQIHLFHQYLTQSTKNFTRHKTIRPLRGNIVDCHNKLLVTNRPIISVYWHGTIQKTSPALMTSVLQNLQEILECSLLDNQPFMSAIKKANHAGNACLIKRDLSFEQLSKIKEQFPNHENLSIETDFERFYPHCSHASHILGYLGRIDISNIGRMGLEELLEERLKGRPGTMQTTINSLGTQISHVELTRALSGADIHTTLDLSLQRIVETIFPENTSGTIIVMNPINGAIQALVSRPNFDPNIFLHPLSTETWSQLQENKPFLNRAFKACYPPGSIFKLITTSAALELNMITTASTTYCRGYSTFAKRQYWCNQRHGHGTLNVEQALAASCNIPFFEIGKHINIDTLSDYAHRFGLGEKTNIILSESSGIVPSRAWKRQHKNEPWWPGETLSVAIGQSFLTVTPIQVARMISSIFTGYLVNPRILVDEPIVTKPLDISTSTLTFLRETMRAAVEQGTGKRAKNKSFTIYGKTSTAQVSDLSKRNQGTHHMEHGWFVSYIQYHDLTPLTMIILLENVGTSRFATPVAQKFLIEYHKLITAQAQKTNK